MIDKFWDWASKGKNSIFSVLCVLIHTFYIVFFAFIDVIPLVVLNIFSLCIYICLIITKKSKTQGAMIGCYLEILIFSLLSTVIAHGVGDFVFLNLCMIMLIFYLAPDFKIPRVCLQIFGFIMAVITIIAGKSEIIISRHSYVQMQKYEIWVSSLNLLISAAAFIIVSHLYTYELRKAQIEADFNVNHDYLTKLYNRRYFHECVSRIEVADKPYIIVMGDIDNFKKINDVYGHDLGDEVLVRVSECFLKSIRKTDMAVRWGGEEFIIFLADTDMNTAQNIIERLQNEIRKLKIPTKWDDLSVTMTFGIAEKKHYRNYEDVIKKADLRLYYGKRNGKNCIISEDLS